MSSSNEPPTKRRRKNRQGVSCGQKLQRLPENAIVSKRPLLRPSIPSPYAGAQAQKVVYVGTKTPFLSAVRRVDKLLRLSDKRLVQSATQTTQNDSRKRRRRDGDDIAAIAEEVESRKRRKGDDEAGEEVVVKGTGKAIAKVMELGFWFQQREKQFKVRLQTSSVTSIDDVSWEKTEQVLGDTTGGEKEGERGNDEKIPLPETVEETRIRKVSVLEVFVSLR